MSDGIMLGYLLKKARLEKPWAGQGAPVVGSTFNERTIVKDEQTRKSLSKVSRAEVVEHTQESGALVSGINYNCVLSCLLCLCSCSHFLHFK